MRQRVSRAAALALAGLLVTAPVVVPAGTATAAAGVTEFSVPIPDVAPLALAAGPNGSIWFTEHAGGLGRISSSGSVREFAVGANAQGGSAVPGGIAAAADGTLWFTDTSTIVPRVGKIDTSSGESTLYAAPTTGTPNFSGAKITDIAAGPDGNMWFTGGSRSVLGKITPAGEITAYATTGMIPYSVTAGPDGGVWFTDTTGGDVGRLDPATGTVTRYNPPSAAGAPNISEITAGPDGALWFTEPGAAKIGRIVPGTGAITEYPVPTASSAPMGITTGPDGNVWFTEAAASNLGKVDPATGTITEYPLPTRPSAPARIISAGNRLWFTETGKGAIGRINPASPPTGTPNPAVTPIAATRPRVAAQYQSWCPTTAIACQTQITTGGTTKIGSFTQEMPPGALRVSGFVNTLTAGSVLQPPLVGEQLVSQPVEVPGGIIGTIPLIGPILGLTPVTLLPFNRLTITQSLAGPVTVGMGAAGLQATAPLNIHLNNTLLGNSCVIGPITASLTPVDASGGSTRDLQLGWQPRAVKITDSTLEVPEADGCGLFGILDGVINSTMGLPSASGNNTLDLTAVLSIGAGAATS